MSPIKLFRKAGKLIRGGAGKPQIMLGCVLGFALGFTVGFNAITLLLIFALLFFNANRLLAAVAILLGKVLNLAAAAVTFRLGYAIIHQLGLEGLFRWMSETPVLALGHTENYCQTGGIVVGVVLGLISGVAISSMVTRLRKALLAGQDSERFQKITGNKVSKFILWLLFGKSKESLEDVLNKRYPIISKKGVVIAVLLVAAVVGLEFALSDSLVASTMEENLSKGVGAEVNIESAHLSLTGGTLKLEGLQITDPEEPTQNMVQAKTVSGTVSIRDLLAKRFVVDEIIIAELKTDQPRTTPGKVYPKPEKPETIPEDTLFNYLQDPEKMREYTRYLQKGQDWLERNRAEADARKEGKTPPPPSIDDLLAEARRFGYQSLSAKNVLSPKPTILIRKLVIEGIRQPDDPATYNVYGQDLTSHPGRIDSPSTLRAESDKGMTGSLTLDFTSPDSLHRIKVFAPGIVLDENTLGGKSSVEIESGTADVEADGGFRAERIDLPVTLVLHDLKARSSEGKSVLGMDPEQANRVLNSVPEWRFEMRLTGTIATPRVTVDAEKTLKSLVEAAGATFMKGQLDSVLKKQAGDSKGGSAMGGLGDLLKGSGEKDKPAETKTEEPTQPKEEKKGLLDGLLN